MHTDTAEEEGDAGDEEAWFLVGEDGEEECCGEGGDGACVAEPGGYLESAEEGEDHDDVDWAEELEEVCCEVLVVWVEAVGG